MKRLIRKADHDEHSREFAIAYINGKIYEGYTHSECVEQYLKEEKDINVGVHLFRGDMVKMKSFKENVEQMAFAHFAEDTMNGGDAIYLERMSMRNIDESTIVRALQEKYPNLPIYNDDNWNYEDEGNYDLYDKIAKRPLD